ncbi:hypothetical protein [Mammaliicoccus lentus]|uniref:hypothetical protein n=1 Tax=Mammaliicoccus lentus TaxID=42858 RepID=UPI00264926CD|nr:hypothetical protein [Mammaliicoccus lentus]
MRCTVQLKNDKYIEITNFKMVKYPKQTQGYNEITEENFDKIRLSNATTYQFIGNETAIIKGEDVLYLYFE